ncbi:MAG: glycosyltransferase family 9 protein [Nitrospiria bacterium]
MTRRCNKILVVRNDRLGDFMLAFSAFALLKENLPTVQVHALIPSYTEEMARLCPWIDQILLDPQTGGKLSSALALGKLLRHEKYDAIITLFSTMRVGLAAALVRIPFRLAPATKAAQIFYNHRLVQRRSLSEKPEHCYNQDLIRYFLGKQGASINKNPEPPFLHFDSRHIDALKSRFYQTHGIDKKQKLIFIHPGSGGSANNLSLEQYARLACSLKSQNGHMFVITAGPGERTQAENLITRINKISALRCILYHSTKGLRVFSEHLRFADLFISGSTGPLHIAGALNTPTAGFYPARRSATALRWQTLNSPSQRLGFSPENMIDPENMEGIDVVKAAELISEHFLYR